MQIEILSTHLVSYVYPNLLIDRVLSPGLYTRLDNSSRGRSIRVRITAKHGYRK